MPSLEILCVGASEPVSFDDIAIVVEADPDCQSHRHPTPLFQQDFDKAGGVLYHLAETSYQENEGAFTAHLLLSDKCRGFEDGTLLEFDNKHLPAIRELISSLLDLSPVNRLIFTTDYQLGPEKPERFGEVTREQFWELHNSGKLRMNSLYPIVTGAE